MGAGKSKVRGRVNYNNNIAYHKYKKQYPDSDVTKQQFSDILLESNFAIRDTILDNPLGFKLPLSIGYIAVDKFKPNKQFKPIDWVASRRLGRQIPRTNLHTFGYTFKVKLYKNPSFRPMLGYIMNAHRLLKRKLAQNIIKEDKQYISIDPTYFSRRFRIDKIIKQP